MKALTVTMAILAIALLFFVLVCGLWIGANGADAESAAFHRMLGIAAVVSGMAVSVLALIAVRKRKTA